MTSDNELSGSPPLGPTPYKQDTSAGHRKRLREKFLKSGLVGFHDYEIVELLFTLGGTRTNMKPQAKEALKRFKTLRGVLEAPLEELQQIKGIGPHSVFGIKLVREVAAEFVKLKSIEKDSFKASKEIFDYLYLSMRGLKKEVFKVLYLDSQNQLIETEDISKGTVNMSAVSPREVIEGAIRHNSPSLVFVHNHPSGNPEPSQSDKDLTRDLVYTGCIMQIRVLDHIIIGDNKYFSLAGAGIIEQAERDFLSLKMKSVSESQRRPYPSTRSPLEPG